MTNWIKLLISIAIPVAVGFTSSVFTRPEIDGWYQTINKPDWQPPNWVFGPVWTILYIMMGISLYFIWKSNAATSLKRQAITLWIIQLVLNFFWSYIFFSQHEIGWALAEIILLWIFILLTIVSTAHISKVAALLLVPYISWVSFAGILTYTISQLNH